MLIIENEDLTQVQFSEITGIKTSTLSHVLTGRNNASPEVLDKILMAYPQYSKHWLIDGVGQMLETEYQDSKKKMIANQQTSNIHPLFNQGVSQRDESKGQEAASKDGDDISKIQHFESTKSVHANRSISKIIVYYDDQTFETFIREK